MSTAPGSALKQFRPKKKKGSSSSRPPSQQNLHQSSVCPVTAKQAPRWKNQTLSLLMPTKVLARRFCIIGGDPFVPGTDNYKRMVAQRRLLYERGQNGGLFTVCENDPCSPDNFLKTVAGNCSGPYKRD